MKEILEKLQGYKTYIIVVLSLVLGVLAGFGIFELPGFVWVILGALGLGALRAAVEAIKKTIEELR